MSDQTYNGWTNWETWNFNLWIHNSERLYNIVKAAATTFDLRSTLIGYLRSTANEIVGTELCLDLKKEDIEKINFHEIAETLKEEF